jgi:diphosphomevalonate decarboxylase
MYENSKLILDSAQAPEPGKIIWRSPSNIAIVKYWGKYGTQLPKNPNLSLTLSSSFTDMVLEYELKESTSNEIELEFSFHQEANEAFKEKIQKYLTSLLPIYPFLNQLKLNIQSGNSFPHSAGIASSASAMSALALCLCSLEDSLFGTLKDGDAFDRKASYLARLGSGSACRSIFSHAAVWGEMPGVEGSSNEYAVPIGDQIHEVFKGFHDDILIVSNEEKSVSSRAGHALMEGNVYADARYTQAKKRMSILLDALKAGDVETFGELAEDEALTLHALMMCSKPSFMLMKPGTIALIEKIRAYRAETKQPLFFSLDAGPNIHLLYPEEIIHDVRAFIDSELKQHCQNDWVMGDWVGEGPEEM